MKAMTIGLVILVNIGVGAQSTLGCTTFLPENARILHNNCTKNIFPHFFFGGGGHVPSLPPVSYTYACKKSAVSIFSNLSKGEKMQNPNDASKLYPAQCTTVYPLPIIVLLPP